MALLERPPPRARATGAAVRRARTLALALALATGPAAAQQHPPSEQELKAAFIHRIAGFIEWPDRAAAGAPLRLCVIGGNPFGQALEAIRGKPVQSRPLEIRFTDSGDALRECQLLFIATAADRHLDRIAALSREAGILTLGDTEGYARRGVMLNFYLDQDRVRFEVNLDALRRGGLKASSKLLTLARIVDAGPNQ